MLTAFLQTTLKTRKVRVLHFLKKYMNHSPRVVVYKTHLVLFTYFYKNNNIKVSNYSKKDKKVLKTFKKKILKLKQHEIINKTNQLATLSHK